VDVTPDETLAGLSSRTSLRGQGLFEEAKGLGFQVLPIFDFQLVDRLLQIFQNAPVSTLGRHTILAGFVRLPYATIRWVSEAIGWPSEKLKKFFQIHEGNCYFYTSDEIRHYYEAIEEMCAKTNTPFSVCYDSFKNYYSFKDLWANPKDCCNALGNVPGFKKVYEDVVKRRLPNSHLQLFRGR
jgi:hypothetical protein